MERGGRMVGLYSVEAVRAIRVIVNIRHALENELNDVKSQKLWHDRREEHEDAPEAHPKSAEDANAHASEPHKEANDGGIGELIDQAITEHGVNRNVLRARMGYSYAGGVGSDEKLRTSFGAALHALSKVPGAVDQFCKLYKLKTDVAAELVRCHEKQIAHEERERDNAARSAMADTPHVRMPKPTMRVVETEALEPPTMADDDDDEHHVQEVAEAEDEHQPIDVQADNPTQAAPTPESQEISVERTTEETLPDAAMRVQPTESADDLLSRLTEHEARAAALAKEAHDLQSAYREKLRAWQASSAGTLEAWNGHLLKRISELTIMLDDARRHQGDERNGDPASINAAIDAALGQSWIGGDWMEARRGMAAPDDVGGSADIQREVGRIMNTLRRHAGAQEIFCFRYRINMSAALAWERRYLEIIESMSRKDEAAPTMDEHDAVHDAKPDVEEPEMPDIVTTDKVEQNGKPVELASSEPDIPPQVPGKKRHWDRALQQAIVRHYDYLRDSAERGSATAFLERHGLFASTIKEFRKTTAMQKNTADNRVTTPKGDEARDVTIRAVPKPEIPPKQPGSPRRLNLEQQRAIVAYYDSLRPTHGAPFGYLQETGLSYQDLRRFRTNIVQSDQRPPVKDRAARPSPQRRVNDEKPSSLDLPKRVIEEASWKLNEGDRLDLTHDVEDVWDIVTDPYLDVEKITNDIYGNDELARSTYGNHRLYVLCEMKNFSTSEDSALRAISDIPYAKRTAEEKRTWCRIMLAKHKMNGPMMGEANFMLQTRLMQFFEILQIPEELRTEVQTDVMRENALALWGYAKEDAEKGSHRETGARSWSFDREALSY